MNKEQEQMSDAIWARNVLQGVRDEHDSTSHARWMLDTLSESGVTEEVRSFAVEAVSGSLASA